MSIKSASIHVLKKHELFDYVTNYGRIDRIVAWRAEL